MYTSHPNLHQGNHLMPPTFNTVDLRMFCFYDTPILHLEVPKMYNKELYSIIVTSSKIMAEKLLVRALKGGKSTKSVNLSGKKIRKIPSTLGKLPNLKILNLQNNQIPNVCPEISFLTQLTLLNLGNNLLKEVPKEMKYLTSLKRLHLFGNQISRFASGACDGLQNLILLNLNDNQLRTLPQEVGRLKSLTFLSLNHNKLTIIPAELCFLKNLSVLHLNYNQLVCLPEEIKFLKKLQELFLVRNNIEDLPQGLCGLKKLRILDIAGNVIQIFPQGFQNLKLTEFYCEGNPLFLKKPIVGVQPKDIWSLQELTARFVIRKLEQHDPFVLHAIESYPEAREKISQGKRCVICGKPFLSEWLECVQFVPPSKTWKISKNLHLVPLRMLLCSHECFDQRGPDLFGIANGQDK